MKKAPSKCPLCKTKLVDLTMDGGGYHSYMWCPKDGVVVKWDCIGQRVVEVFKSEVSRHAANLRIAKQKEDDEVYELRKYSGP